MSLRKVINRAIMRDSLHNPDMLYAALKIMEMNDLRLGFIIGWFPLT